MAHIVKGVRATAQFFCANARHVMTQGIQKSEFILFFKRNIC